MLNTPCVRGYVGSEYGRFSGERTEEWSRHMPSTPTKDSSSTRKRRSVAWETVDLNESLEGLTLEADNEDLDDPILVGADGKRVRHWRENYPYEDRLERPEYERQKRHCRSSC